MQIIVIGIFFLFRVCQVLRACSVSSFLRGNDVSFPAVAAITTLRYTMAGSFLELRKIIAHVFKASASPTHSFNMMIVAQPIRAPKYLYRTQRSVASLEITKTNYLCAYSISIPYSFFQYDSCWARVANYSTRHK
jgi:hypothetical protein